ncbi:import inner membrane translocase subunit tim-50 mitochondrial precursor [Aspergillus heteromorphus CBS 117.55]|uniref:Mitochondrial import inner membrane translocase subunit TIM50 n=1 Tax=Aspergillus heteromorphus CBS 117.55 TaxID=1448321 RepID=A0A317X3L2_9EURO|nr:import inner membrane translocase subunit tim-50 mitochondrial precursor [Aspergillus heteromorphus CBS 117.55]PWY91140.1 import inner membrane translocase subunit tim-50 mitochondrial precursor [Aspergillus heteromorphus CBS 117.55]
MLSRAVLPLTRPNVLASTVRVSSLSSQSRWYAKVGKPKAPYKLPDSVKASKPDQPPKAPSQQQDYSADQAEFDAANTSQKAAEASESGSTVPQHDAPQKPLPDLTQGIPSTLAAELEGRSKNRGPLNLTEDAREEYDEGGRGDVPPNYESSLDRKRARMANLMYVAFLLAGAGGVAYLGRSWDSEEEERMHPTIPSGWGLGLWYSRAKARLGDLTSYYKDPAFPKLLPDEDPNMRQPYTLVLSLEDLLVHSEWSREHGWRVAKRPGVDYFLRYLNQYYELVLFTTVPSMMADQVLRKLDPYRIIRWPLFREATRYKDGEYIKDLSYLNRDLSKVILIDTKEEHARLQPENAIVLDKWNGNPKDKTLVALIPFLEYLAGMGVEDVRPVLKSFEGSPIPVEFAKREKAMRERFEKELAEEQKKRPRSGMGSFASALGLKSSRTLDGEQSPSEGLAQGKMLWDQIRERGQKNYELIEKEIRENGEKWLSEMAAEEEKARQEQMAMMKGSFTGMFGAGGDKKQ